MREISTGARGVKHLPVFASSAIIIAICLFVSINHASAQGRASTSGSSRESERAAQVRALNNSVLQLHGQMQENASGAAGLHSQAAIVLARRATALQTLIQEDPHAALTFAFSPELLADLAAKFPESAGLLETHGTWQGPAEVSISDDLIQKVSKTSVRLKAAGREFDVHFAGPQPAELQCGKILQVTGIALTTTMAAAGGTVTGTALPAASCGTTGTQNSAVLLVNFPGTTAPAGVTQASMNSLFFGTSPSLDGYWKDASYGQTGTTGSVFGWYTLSGTYTCSSVPQFIADAVDAAANGGVNFQNYSRVFVVFPDMPTSCGWAGLSSIGCYTLTTTSGTYTLSTSLLVWNHMTTADEGVPLIAHEAGHQLGLAHARLRQFGSEPLGPLGTAGTLSEYGDHFSAMGYPNFGHYASQHKSETLNWESSGTNLQTVQSSGTYTVAPFENNPAGLNALKIQRGTGNNAWLWVEYRQPLGSYDSNLSPTQLFSGALVHYEDSLTGPQTDLLDFTPLDTYGDYPALAAGQSWTDPYTNLSFSVQSATTTGLTLNVSYGATPCTSSAPGLVMSPLDPSVYPGQSASYSVSVTNNDSLGCSPSTITLGSSEPAGWSTSLSSSAVSLSPGQSALVTLGKGAPSGTPMGTYAVNLTAANNSANSSATANATVMTPPSIAVDVSVAGTSFSRPGTVPLSAIVTSGGTPLSGATVTFIVTTPTGGTATQNVTTNASGGAAWNYKLNQRSAVGLYSVTAQARTGSAAKRAASTLAASANALSFSVQ
jgi:M6 family metalloprotease-like protein